MTKTQKIALMAYAGLLVTILVAMMASTQFAPTAQEQMMGATTEAFKIIVSAFVGALSAVLGGNK